jgi:DNA processing protein
MPLLPYVDIPEPLQYALPPVERLWYEGSLQLLQKPLLSVVGSRHMSPYGKGVVDMLIKPVAAAGVSIVSGLAYGIDAQAHRAALAAEGTGIAVLGSSLTRVYPAAHYGLARQLVSQGGLLLTEYEEGQPVYKTHFLARNRIIAALSPVLLVIEASDRSGTFSTVRAALDLGKEVCVVPGDITRVQSQGVNRLLKEGARPVTSPEDIVALYQLSLPLSSTQEKVNSLTGSAATLYVYISQGVQTNDELVQKTGWSIATVRATLSVLELEGLITSRFAQWQITSSS